MDDPCDPQSDEADPSTAALVPQIVTFALVGAWTSGRLAGLVDPLPDAGEPLWVAPALWIFLVLTEGLAFTEAVAFEMATPVPFTAELDPFWSDLAVDFPSTATAVFDSFTPALTGALIVFVCGDCVRTVSVLSVAEADAVLTNRAATAKPNAMRTICNTRLNRRFIVFSQHK